MDETNYAIVFSPYVELKTKPSLNSTTAFELRDGNKVKIIDSNEDWYEISFGVLIYVKRQPPLFINFIF